MTDKCPYCGAFVPRIHFQTELKAQGEKWEPLPRSNTIESIRVIPPAPFVVRLNGWSEDGLKVVCPIGAKYFRALDLKIQGRGEYVVQVTESMEMNG